MSTWKLIRTSENWNRSEFQCSSCGRKEWSRDDDEPRRCGCQLTAEQLEARVAELEARIAELEATLNEVCPVVPAALLGEENECMGTCAITGDCECGRQS